MSKRLAIFCAILLAWGHIASADTPSFGGPVLQAPPRGESGPLGQNAPTFNVDQAAAQSPAESAPPPPPDAARIQAFVDGMMSGLVTAGEFPGAVVLVIRDGKVILKSGYGFADIRARIPVDPDRTRFRVASISKLFTATAVMQLIEQGKADLNADVNTYLTGFKVPSNFPEPVTLANLLTHTAGFDDRYLGIGAPLTSAAQPLGPYLARTLPQRVFPPGKIFAYSNHGFGLAGNIVENVSGQEFGAYIQSNIFTPLGMESSSFGVPYPVPSDIAVPYFQGGEEGGFMRAELDRVQASPAGDLITTAADIAKFMAVHLNKGAYGDDEHLLSEATIERMHAQHFAEAEGLDGWAYGFAEGHRNGVRWIGHDGSWLGFCAQLVLVPEKNAGFFVAYNADCRFQASEPLKKSLFDLLWPTNAAIVVEPNAKAEQLAQKLVGTYMSVRRARADFTVIAAAASELTLTAPGEGKLLVKWPAFGRNLVFLPRANGTWINPDFQMKAAALLDAQGNPSRFAIDTQVFDRVAGAGDWGVWSAALGFVVVVCVVALWTLLAGSLRRQFFGEDLAVIGFVPRLAGFAAAGLTLIVLLGLAKLLGEKMPLAIIHGPSALLSALVSAPALIAVLALPMTLWSIKGFGKGPRARLAQAGYALLTIAIMTFLAFALQWGLHPLSLAH